MESKQASRAWPLGRASPRGTPTKTKPADELSVRHEALHRSLVLRQVLSAACFDAEDRALAEAHIQTCLRSLLGALNDAPQSGRLDVKERMKLLSFATETQLLPSTSFLFAALVKKQAQLSKRP